MIKFNRSNTHDLYTAKKKNRKLGNSSHHTVSSSEELEPPLPISLENLRALISSTSENGLESPKSISLESLINYSNSNGEELPVLEDICLDDLKNLISKEKACTESDESIENSTNKLENIRPRQLKKTRSNNIPTKDKHLDGTVALAIAVTTLSGQSKLPQQSTSSEEGEGEDSSEDLSQVIPQIKNRRRSEKPVPRVIQKTVSLPALPKLHQNSAADSDVRRELRNRRRYVHPNSLTEEVTKSPKLKNFPEESECKNTRAEQKEKAANILQKKHEILLEKLKELSEGDNLENWLSTLTIPKEMNVPEIREKILDFFKEKSWEHNKENSKWLLDGSLTKRLWSDFKELSTAKQIIIIIGIAILITLVGFLTMQLLSFLWPGLLGLATSGEGILVEIGVEAFKQRQEPAFHLLMNHAEQAKPLTTAWANQYVLWKYMRR